MAKETKDPQAAAQLPTELPPGVKLLRTLKAHENWVYGLAFDPLGRTIASGSADGTARLRDARDGTLLRTLVGHNGDVYGVGFDPKGAKLANGNQDGTVRLWDMHSGKLLRTLDGHNDAVYSVTFDPQGKILASGDANGFVHLWDVQSGSLLTILKVGRGAVYGLAIHPQGTTLASSNFINTARLWDIHTGKLLSDLEVDRTLDVAFSSQGDMLASAGLNGTIKLWAVRGERLLRTLEGHTNRVDAVDFSPDDRLLASRSGGDGTIRIWNCETWETVATLAISKRPHDWTPALAFHPTQKLLAAACSKLGAPDSDRAQLIYFWELDYDVLLGKRARTAAAAPPVHHTTGKIVLVGDHSVGKSALGHRLIHGNFEKQESTHGQKFWVFPALGKRRADGTVCEAILWDFAGQPDYRLVHALFVDNADLALVLFDASDLRDPLHGVGFWLKQLKTGGSHCPIVLVAAQTDRGTCSLTPDELTAFCQKHNIIGPISTSALTGLGMDELVDRMKALIPWEEKATTVTTATFKRIKDYVLGLKEIKDDHQAIVTPEELCGRLQAIDADWEFTDAEMLTAVGHLENYGYLKRLRTSNGESRILLQPERLNNLASSLVLEARRNPKGLGALEEKRLLAGGYDFPELKDLHDGERDILLDSAALLFLEHNVCFRETDPLRKEPYLVFPELINLKKPPEDDAATEDGVAYTVSGPTENVFASLVVLLGYTHTFTRTAQWHDNARYEVGDGLVCGFRQEAERDGELDFVLSFSPQVGIPVRTLFQGLFESFLARRNLTVSRYEPVRCTNPECGHLLDRSVVRQRLKDGKKFAFCNDCGEKLVLPMVAEPIQLAREVQAEVEAQRHAAEQRTRFEQAVFRVRAHIAEQNITPPDCFISYAWGQPEHERWVEKRLATDLQKAGFTMLLDRWENPPGSSLLRYVDRLEKAARIVVIGTSRYRQKYDNEDPAMGTVVAAECKLIAKRMRGPEHHHRAIVPALLEGNPDASFPPCLHDQVFCDFRNEAAYFTTAFDLILSLYQIAPNDPAVADLRESLEITSSGKPARISPRR